MGFRQRARHVAHYLGDEGCHVGAVCPHHVSAQQGRLYQLMLTPPSSGTNLVQRRLLKATAIWVVCAFVGDELALFLICRPLSQYWAVPAEYGKSLLGIDSCSY